MDLETEVQLIDSDKSKQKIFSKPRSEYYLRDVTIIMNWLSSKFKSEEVERKQNNLIVLPRDPFQKNKENDDVINLALCYLTTFSMNLFTLKNDCSKILRT